MKIKISVLLMLLITYICLDAVPSYAKESFADIDTSWHFYEEKLLERMDVQLDHSVLNLPIEFDDISNTKVQYGTFIKKITIPENKIGEKLGILLPFTYSAAKVFIDGQLVEEIGKVSSRANEHETDLKNAIIQFTPDNNEFEIAIQISSFGHIRGGFSEAPILSDWDKTLNQYNFNFIFTIFIGTIIFVVGIATLTIGLMNRNEKLFLIFGMFSILIAARSLVAVPFIYHDLDLPISYLLATRIEYITTPLSFVLYAVFIYILYDKLFSKWMLALNASILLSIASIVSFTEPAVFQSVFFAVFPFALIFVIYNIWVMIKALKSKLRLAKSMLMGVALVLIGLLNDYLAGMGITNIPPLAHIMIALNVLLILFALCKNYVLQVNKVSKLKDELDLLVKARTDQLNEANKELSRLVNIDALTGIYNRHKFNNAIVSLFGESERNNEYLSLLLIDVDEFKSYNDYYGHVSGDELLIELTKSIQEALPNDIIFSRYGGEELAIILPKYSLETATQLAEYLRLIIEEKAFVNIARKQKIVTISIGCSERTQDQALNEKSLIELADDRLYKSKAAGRNKVTSATLKIKVN